MLSNAATIRNGLSLIALENNNSKCELLIINHTTSKGWLQTNSLFQDQFPSLSILNPQLLGSHLSQESAPLQLEAKTNMLENIENHELLRPHQAIFILKYCFSIHEHIYLLHSALCFKWKEYAMWLMDKKAGHKHPYQMGMEALASVLLLTCLCHAFCPRLKPARALLTVRFPFSSGSPLMGNKRRNRTPWFITTTKVNTISLEWVHLQKFTWCLVQHSRVLGTTVGYSLHKWATWLAGQKPCQLLILELAHCSALISSILQLPYELLPRFLKAQNATVVKLLMS